MKKLLNKHTFKVFFTFLGTFVVLFLIMYVFYSSLVNISNKYTDKFDSTNDISSLFDFDLNNDISYSINSDPDYLYINIPKNYLYSTILDLSDLNNYLYNFDKITIKQIGITSNTFNNSIDFNADIKYKNLLNYYSYGNLNYVINSNTIDLYVNYYTIGDGLPEFIYRSFSKINNKQILYSIDLKDLEYINNGILYVDNIDSIIIKNNTIQIKYRIDNRIDKLINYIYDDSLELNSDEIYELAPFLLEFKYGESSLEYEELIKEYIKQ